jgi:hypothetical protein
LEPMLRSSRKSRKERMTVAGDPEVHELTVEAFGVRIRVASDTREVLERVTPLLPPGSRACDPAPAGVTFSLRAGADGTYVLDRDGVTVMDEWPLDVALSVLERELRMLVALEAPEFVFVHAGAVAYRGLGIVIPGESFAGKSSLVAALVQAGAEYCSDEYAVLDARGLLHPFAKPLSLRERVYQSDHSVESLGGVTAQGPVPVGMVVVTSFRQGAEWRPRRLSSGEAVLGLLSHTVPAQTRPDHVMPTLTRSCENAMALEGERGEADRVAEALLTELERQEQH